MFPTAKSRREDRFLKRQSFARSHRLSFLRCRSPTFYWFGHKHTRKEDDKATTRWWHKSCLILHTTNYTHIKERMSHRIWKNRQSMNGNEDNEQGWEMLKPSKGRDKMREKGEEFYLSLKVASATSISMSDAPPLITLTHLARSSSDSTSLKWNLLSGDHQTESRK